MQGGKPFWRRWMPYAAFLWLASLLPAQAPPRGEIPAAVWDVSAALAPPAWFGPVQTAAAINMTVWRAPVRPPPGQSRLAVTLVFEETQGGFARLIWQGPGRAVTICGNLYEGAAALHARTLLLDRETLAGAGQLIVEATGNRMPLLRAELAWVEPLVLAAGGWTPPGLFLASSGKVFPGDELQGSGRKAPQDENRGRIFDAVLDAGPVQVRPSAPVRFLTSISASPAQARLEAQVAGLGPAEEPLLWLNGHPVGAVAVELPGLEDAGYRRLFGASDLSYGGWRKVTAHVPSGWLQPGENQLDWQCPPGSTGMTLRHLRLQVSYEKPAFLATAPTAPAPSGASPAPVPAPAFSHLEAPQLRLGLSSGAGAVKLRPE